MKKINPDSTLYEIIKENPGLKEVLYNLGFSGVKNEAMLNTHAKIMTLRKGSEYLNIDKEKIKEEFKKAGFELEF